MSKRKEPWNRVSHTKRPIQSDNGETSCHHQINRETPTCYPKSDQDFAASMCAQFSITRQLTEKQWPYVLKLDKQALAIYRNLKSVRKATECYIYGITQDQAIKVGISGHPTKRLADMQAGNAETLRITWQVLAPNRTKARAIETRIHRQFAKHNLTGEWFTSTIANDAQEMATAMANNHASGNRARWPVPVAVSRQHRIKR